MQEFKELFVRVFCEGWNKNVGKESMWIQFSKLIDWGDMSLYKIVRDREGCMNFGIRRDVKLNFSTTLSGEKLEGERKIQRGVNRRILERFFRNTLWKNTVLFWIV